MSRLTQTIEIEAPLQSVEQLVILLDRIELYIENALTSIKEVHPHIIKVVEEINKVSVKKHGPTKGEKETEGLTEWLFTTIQDNVEIIELEEYHRIIITARHNLSSMIGPIEENLKNKTE